MNMCTDHGIPDPACSTCQASGAVAPPQTAPNVDEVKAAKRQAENEVGEILRRLQEKTGCDVDSVSLTSAHRIGGRPYHDVQIDLRVPR